MSVVVRQVNINDAQGITDLLNPILTEGESIYVAMEGEDILGFTKKMGL